MLRRTLLFMLLVVMTSISVRAQCVFNSLQGSPNPVTVGSTVNFTWNPPTGTCPTPPAEGAFVGYRFYIQEPGAGSFTKDTTDPGTTPPLTHSYTPNQIGVYAFKVAAVYSTNPGCPTCPVVEEFSNTVNITSQCTFSIDPTSNNVGPGAASGTINVTTQSVCAWTAVSNHSFITITGGANGTGNGTVNYNVAANTGAERTGTITVAGQTFTVNQESGCTYSIMPTSTTVGASATSAMFGVTAGSGCTWTAVSNDAFIIITGGASGSGNGTVSYSVAANTGVERTGSITAAELIFTVNQAAGCTYSIMPTSTSVGASATSGTIDVTAGVGCTWGADSNDSFIVITGGTSGSGNGTVSYDVGANTGSARTGTITVAGLTFTVFQAGLQCAHEVTPMSADVGTAGGSGSFSVLSPSDCSWTAVSNHPFVTIVSGGSGNGNGVVNYNVLPNSASSRTGTIAVIGQTETKIFTIRQSGPTAPKRRRAVARRP